MSGVLEGIYRRARAADAVIALPEAADPRVLGAAARAARDGWCRPLLIGDPGAAGAAARALGIDLGGLDLAVHDPASDPALEAMAAAWRASLDARGIAHDGLDALRELAAEPLFHAALLVREGRADAAVMGAVATTRDTLRAALRAVGLDPRFRVVTSCFLMILPDGRALTYADCGVIPEPTPEQLADIAMQAADRHRALIGDEPRVALLSFSTKGSAQHPSVERVRAAVAELEKRRLRGEVDFAFDGELQGDAALVAEVAAAKAPGSLVAGRANVLVFPDLNSGNIAYKLTERLAHARAIGPLLQGLLRPVHDLSRGCSEGDVLDTMAIAAVDAARRRQPR